ncbi:MAG: 4Fe-4S dicluster domain-containing protein [Proteobacteria bacterium]|nr:4Fe-4S dicluster domain-containing protein [Pseudomonadota bacterium]
MEKLTFRIKKNDCMGCHACEVACKQEYDLKVGPRLIRIIENMSDFQPVYCHHCAKPPCRDACPVEAIFRNERGVVLIDNERCIGCRECIDACPFGAMQFDEDAGLAVKCDLCLDRVLAGREPACQAICPTRCINTGDKKSIAAVFEEAAR